MRDEVIFEAIVNEKGILCIRIPGLHPAIGADGPLAFAPADMGKRFWKRVIRVFQQECNIRFGPESQLYRVAKIREKIEIIEKGLRRGTSLFPRRRS